MLTINDIINASFNKSNFGGYKTEDVDIFIDEVKESYELLIKKNIEQKEANESLAEENRKLAKKIDLLAKKVEEYRDEENEIKNALISAQKLSEAAIREARHKAEIILKDAQMKADEKVASIADEVEEKKEELELLFDYYYGCRFYENGLIYAPASHSGYTYNDDFWPYEVYRYNEMENMYECIASVEELDLNACPEYKDNFPFKDDKDGDKKIYFVRFYEDSLRLDEGEYNDWKEKLFESDLFELNWHTLS